VQGITERAFETISASATVVFQMPDDGLNSLATFDPRPLASGESFGLAAVQDLHPLETSAPIAEINDGSVWFFTAQNSLELPPSDRTVGCRLMEAADELTG